MNGSLNANAEAAWGKTLDNLVARAEVHIGASMHSARGGNATPINGTIHARYEGARQIVSIQQSSIKTPQDDYFARRSGQQSFGIAGPLG